MSDPDSSGARRPNRSETVNPLQPYFLVYVRDDGNVRFTFAQPKQILEIYRHLCSGNSTPCETLCDLVDRETDSGSKMGRYSNLLARALASITHTFKRRSASALQSGRGGLLIPVKQQASEESEFELITWLVIKSL